MSLFFFLVAWSQYYFWRLDQEKEAVNKLPKLILAQLGQPDLKYILELAWRLFPSLLSGQITMIYGLTVNSEGMLYAFSKYMIMRLREDMERRRVTA